ncbi:MAG: hypothetical protein AB4050_08240 [Synechococcus sp.]
MPISESIDFILVPQGAEYQAVERGLRRSGLRNLPLTIAIPVGPLPVMSFLANMPVLWSDRESPNVLNHTPNIVVMGLCGGLSPSMTVGQRVIPDVCLTHFSQTFTSPIPSEQSFSPSLCQTLKDSLLPPHSPSTERTLLVSSDRAVCVAQQKQQLHRTTGATIVDMEGAAVLAAFSDRPVSVAMLRVVSDGCANDLPDLNAALTADGSLSPLQLAVQMMRHPVRASHLIGGSLRALKALSVLAEDLGCAL